MADLDDVVAAINGVISHDGYHVKAVTAGAALVLELSADASLECADCRVPDAALVRMFRACAEECSVALPPAITVQDLSAAN